MPSRNSWLDPRREPTLRKGPALQSKRVTDRMKAAYRLTGAINSLKAGAADGFCRRFEDELREGETVPDPTLALELAGRSVRTALDQLLAADDAYCSAGAARRRLNRACAGVARNEVYPEVKDLRHDLDSIFGREGARRLHHMEGRTRRKPKRLLDQLRFMVVSLGSESRLPRPKRASAVLDRAGWLRRVEPGYKKLRAMLEELAERESEEVRLRAERDYELESFDVVYGEMLAYVRSVYCLGGFGEKVIWHLLPTVQQRRLRGKARQEGEARADGKRPRRTATGSGGSASPNVA